MLQPSESEQLAIWIRQEAALRGFHLTGICPAIQPPHYHAFCNWLDQGMSGTMTYLPERRSAYQHPRHVLDGAQSVIMLALSYHSGSRIPTSPGQGKIARYAWGTVDYHDWIHHQFKEWLRKLKQVFPRVQARGVVDTAPLLERDMARLAGIGWQGKNTMLINKRSGSYFLLAAILVDQILPYDSPHEKSHCGTCTRCLDACPTDAFPEPGVLDARRCISYLTIETRQATPTELRSGIGDWVFGCDICQDVCPWNRHHQPSPVQQFHPDAGHNPLNLLELFQMDDDQFRDRFRKTPMWRSRRIGMLRNAALVLGNQRVEAAVPFLTQAIVKHEDPTLDAHCLWALGQIGTAQAHKALQELPTLPDELEAERQSALDACRTK